VRVLVLVVAVVCVAALAEPGVAQRDGDQAVPILEYHVIGTAAAGAPNAGLYVSPAELRAQTSWLARHGWHTVTLGEVARSWRGGKPLPHDPVVLSFDDGYPGDWRFALPILHAHRFVGVLNLQIGNLVPLRVRQLLAAGWEVDSHTFTHPDLRSVSNVQLKREVVTSRHWLQRVFDIPVPAFCYPAGDYDARVVAAVRRGGYLLGETERPGRASPSQGLLTLDRLRVGPTTNVADLARLLRP